MATYVDQAYYGWPHEELPRQDDSQEVSSSQMLDHGSISFGRFAQESLSWERRSVFTFNKCQEEFEKFKSPGLVAKKKAYFEEYYKRIRAMKALQESQQTELTLDYGGDGSISSQTGEDETTVHLEDLRGGAARDVVTQPEVSTSAYAVKGTYCSKAIEDQIEHSDPEEISSDSDSFKNITEEHEEGDEPICPSEMQHLDVASGHESLAPRIEDLKHHNLTNLEDKGVRENNISDKHVKPEVAPGDRPLCLINSKEGEVEAKPAHNIASGKVLPAVRKVRGSVSVPKESSAPARKKIGSNLPLKIKPNIQKPPLEQKRPVKKLTAPSGRSIGPSKTTTNQVAGNNRSTIVAQHRPLREVHPNVTTPRPFSLATDKRAVVPSRNREGGPKMDPKSLNHRPPSATERKEATNIQVPSKRTVISSSKKSKGLEDVKSTRLENRRVHEVKKRPVTSENKSTGFKARDTKMTESIKARSLNLPPRNKFSSNSATTTRFKGSIRNEKCEEGTHEAKVAGLRHSDAKVATTPKVKTDAKVSTPLAAKMKTDSKCFTASAAKLRTESKKMAPSCIVNSSTSSRRPRFGELSLDGKKSRQEKQQWR